MKEKNIEQLEETNNDYSKIKKELDLEIVNRKQKQRSRNEKKMLENNKEIVLCIVSEKKQEVKQNSEKDQALNEERGESRC